MLPLPARVDLEAIAKKRCSAFPKAPALMELHHRLFSVISRSTPLQRYNQCILQHKLTGKYSPNSNDSVEHMYIT